MIGFISNLVFTKKKMSDKAQSGNNQTEVGNGMEGATADEAANTENAVKTNVYNLIILDKSGSMSSIHSAAINGFNETVKGIREAQDKFAKSQVHYISLLTFCACKKEYVYNRVPVAKVHQLTEKHYMPCCGTPLYDAMGLGINDMIRHTKDDPDAMVTVTIITDGMENASREYSGREIKALVEAQKEKGWNFAYIGTNQDVDAVSVSLSIENTMFFEDTDEGMSEAWERERKSKLRQYGRVYYSMENSAGIAEEERRQLRREAMNSRRKYQEMGEFLHRVTPEHITELRPGQVFVFGSDIEGLHGGGAARTAVRLFGATKGQGEGLQGQSYAIPTTNELPQQYVERFLDFAQKHPEMTFLVTRVGCGRAGHSVREMAHCFVGAVDMENVWLPKDFWLELI